jgi:hypothetical protein
VQRYDRVSSLVRRSVRLSAGGRHWWELSKEGARGYVCGVPAWEKGGEGEKEEDGIGLARADAV